MSPGRRAATSTKPPCAGAVYVAMKKLSPPSAARLSDFITPPCALACSVTPADMAIIAPDSTRTVSPAPSVSRATP